MKFLRDSLPFVVSVLIFAQNAYSMADSALTFYPLANGNLWQYKSTRYNNRSSDWPTGYYTVVVAGDTILPNAKRYFQLQCSQYSLVHPRFQRIDSSTGQVFAYDTAQGGREVQIDSLRGLPHSGFLGSRLLFLYGTAVTAVDSQSCLGAPMLCRSYYSGPGISFGGYYLNYSLAGGLGLAFVSAGYYDDDFMSDSGTSDTLTYARVNGVEHGTLVSVPKPPQPPGDFVLCQNYPNPFNPSTTIRYQLSTRSHVSLTILDCLGRVVATIVDNTQDAGLYSITFTADRLSTGIYFYRLRAGVLSETRKLMLLK